MPSILNLKRIRIEDGLRDEVYIGRGGKWGNPHPLTSSGRVLCLGKYINHLKKSGLWKQVYELRGKDLLCYCTPDLCHGHVLMYLSRRECLNEQVLDDLVHIAFHNPAEFERVLRDEADKASHSPR